MSLSQKHSGRVLVPWFDTAEWRYVFELIYSNNKESQSKALEILKVWKIRTPLLSAGVEGSLIILEALLIDRETLSDYQLSQILAVTLMRFLNICAANNDRQGTFHKSALAYELPKWLISLRHDIAHNHKLPSKSMLELSLNYCFNWLKKKYWEAQNLIISDYVVLGETPSAELRDILSFYTQLCLNSYTNQDVDKQLQSKISKLVSASGKNQQGDFNKKNMIGELERLLRDALSKNLNGATLDIVAEIVASETVLLAAPPLEDTQKVSKEIRDIWAKLLGILYETGFIFGVVNRLLDLSLMENAEQRYRHLASVWISEIFQAMIKTRTIKEKLENILSSSSEPLDAKTSAIVLKSIFETNPLFGESMDFSVDVTLPLKQAESFQERAIGQPSDFTLIFLEKVLNFNNSPDGLVKDTLSILKNFTSTKANLVGDEIYTSDNLTISSDFGQLVSGLDKVVDSSPLIRANCKVGLTTRWKVVKDSSSFKGLPLGILPNQNRDTHSFLV